MTRAKKTAAIIAFVILILYAGVLTLVTVSLWLECRASDTLLHMLALAQPGVPISEISGQLGPQLAVFSERKDLLRWGSMADESFYRGKKLFMFQGVMPPYRTVWVYTDANEAVVYATWKSE